MDQLSGLFQRKKVTLDQLHLLVVLLQLQVCCSLF